MADEIHVGDIGTEFIVTIVENGVPVDISSASTKEIVFRSPNGPGMAKPADFVTNGSDGKLKYQTVANDLDDDGNWKLQGKVTLSGGSWSSEKVTFVVHPNIPVP